MHHAQYIARRGEINAWITQSLWRPWKQQVKQLIIAGTITSVCMAFPAISAVMDGYQVFVVIDASGTYSKWHKKLP